MNKSSKFFTIILTTLLLSACVQVTEDPKQNKSQIALSSVRDLPIIYPQQSAFALSPRYVKKVSLKPAQQKNVYQWYGKAIVKNLQAHHYVESTNEAMAKFYVGFGIALDKDFNDQDIIEKFGITPGLYASEQLKKGSFLIYIDDVATGKRVWRGAVQGFVQGELSEQDRLERIENVVDMVLKQFYQQN